VSFTQYQHIVKRRVIIHRGAVLQKIRTETENKSEDKVRAIILSNLKAAHKNGMAEIKKRLKSGQTGKVTASSVAYLTDQIIRILYDITVFHVFPMGTPTASERISLVATGGFGRSEMAPFSDIDIMFLVPYKRTPWVESVTEYILYMLWDLGLKVGHSIRSADDCLRIAKKDLSVKTALLDARFVWGEQALFKEFKEVFFTKIVAKKGIKFVEEKLAERDARHTKMGDTRYFVEPNIKDGKGGMRDLQTIYWISLFLFDIENLEGLREKGVLREDELKLYKKAEEFFWLVRCHLHFETGRATEQITFDQQTTLAKLLKYRNHPGLAGVERFMKHYYLVTKQVGDLTRIFCASLEDQEKKKTLFRMSRFSRQRKIGAFKLDSGRLTLVKEKDIKDDPILMLDIFAVANNKGYDIHPTALRLIQKNLKLITPAIRKDQRAGAVFLDILTSKKTPDKALLRMNEAGVFGRFMPDFGRIIAQMQHDMYHHYTVDEHTIRAIGLLSRIEKGELEEDHPVASKLVGQIVSRRAIYMAVLLHDIAKGRGGDHSVLGAEIANKLCPQLGLTPAETEVVSWLVRHHLLMSNVAFKRDIADPKTIADFALFVKSPERLKLLLILTVVDIRAVGPGIWTGWKRQLLTDLYQATEEYLVAGHVEKGQGYKIDEKKKALSATLKSWKKEIILAHEKRFRDAYWLSEDLDTQHQNALLVAKVDKEKLPLGVKLIDAKDGSTTRVSVYIKDQPGLFSHLAGALAELGANILDAKIHTTFDGMALDNFMVDDMRGGAFKKTERAARLYSAINDWVYGDVGHNKLINQESIVAKKSDVFSVEPIVLFDNRASEQHTLLEMNAKDRRGLLHKLTRELWKNRVSVLSAHVATYGERAVDVFYIQELDGKKITNANRLKSLEKKLLVAARG
jgi:[protein-PII] uridylyltransferase